MNVAVLFAGLAVSFLMPAVATAEVSSQPAPAPSATPVVGGPPQAGPAPRLEMNDYRGREVDVRATGAVTMQISYTTKTVGPVFWHDSTVNVLPDTAYSRWVVASFIDRWLLRTKTFAVDKAVDKCCWRDGTTDASGNVTIQHLAPGKYIAFGAYYEQTGKALDRFVNYNAFDQNGNPATASIPTLVFQNAVFETLVMLTPFEITAAAPHVQIAPVFIIDGVYS